MDVSLTLPEGISGEEWVFLYNQYRVKMTNIGLHFVSSTSDARDVDYASAITQLSSDMLALEAAQSTFAKVSQLSILNFIR